MYVAVAADPNYDAMVIFETSDYFRDTFVIFDKDGDGTIDSKELSTVLKSMGYNPTKEEIQEMVDEVGLSIRMIINNDIYFWLNIIYN